MAIDLTKRAETAQKSLINMLKAEASKGNDLGDLTAQIVLVMDYSGSMGNLYANGTVQDIAERVLGLSMSGLDDDQIVPVEFFSHEAFDVVEATPTNYQNFVENWRNGTTIAPPTTTTVRKGLFGRKTTVTTPGHTQYAKQMGGTDYLVAINKVIDYLKDSDALTPGKPPVLVLFVTDGATSNESAIKHALIQAAGLPIFWQFLGLGYIPQFLSDLDNMGGRVVDNVGLFDASHVASMSDETFYDKIIAEFFPSWLPAARKAGIVTV